MKIGFIGCGNMASAMIGGILEKGMPADINIFHLDKLKVHADFENPDQYCTGFDYVLVGGEIAVKQDEYRNPQSGRIVRGCNK